MVLNQNVLSATTNLHFMSIKFIQQLKYQQLANWGFEPRTFHLAI